MSTSNANPIYTDTSRGRPFAKDPAVIAFNGKFFMYYSVPSFGDGRSCDGWGIAVACSDDMDYWTRVCELERDEPYERQGIAAPAAIVLDGQIHLFYQSYGNGPRDAVCHATSSDGIRFERNPTNPVFSPVGEWNNGRAIDADVVANSGKLFLFAATRDPSGSTQFLCGAAADLDSAFGRAAWTQLGVGPLLSPELGWEQRCIEAPAVMIRNGRFHMFYAGAFNCAPQQIGHAISDDGVRWTRTSDQPFFPSGIPGTWNASESGHPYIFEHDNATHLFFQGSNDSGLTWYLGRVELVWSGDTPHVK